MCIFCFVSTLGNVCVLCVFTGLVSRELCEQQEYGAGVGGSSSAQRHLHQGTHTHMQREKPRANATPMRLASV